MDVLLALATTFPAASAGLLLAILIALYLSYRHKEELRRLERENPLLYRRSCYRPARAPGDGWPVRCKPCGGLQRTRGGACAGCGEPMLPDPSATSVPVRGFAGTLALALPRLLLQLWPITLATLVALAIHTHKANESVSDWSYDIRGSRRWSVAPRYQTSGFSWEKDVFVPSLISGLFFGSLLGYPFLSATNSFLRAKGTLRDIIPFGRTRVYGRGVVVEKSWFEVRTLRGRRGLAIHIGLGVNGYTGAPLDLTVRLRGPDGHYLASTLAAYRGPHGELLRRYRTGRIRNQAARFPDLWVYLPTRALPLSPHAAPVELVAEVLVSIRGAIVLEHDLPFRFEPQEEDLPVLISAPRASPEERAPRASSAPGDEALDLSTGGVELLGPGGPGDSLDCQICGGELEDDAVPCSSCDTPHHADCWDFMGRCSTYGCEGTAQR